MTARAFEPGFRISRRDFVVLALGGTAAGAVAHFFLFCNVFRLSRGLELLQASRYVGLAGYAFNAA